MPSHAAFLRGVNLGARRKVKGAELRAILDGAGFTNVAPFRTSGNVVFEAGRESEAEVTKRTEAALAEATGFEVKVFVRNADQIRAIAARQPFPRKLVDATEGRLQVILLSRKPTPAAGRKVLATATADDRLALEGRELYWLPAAGTQTAEWSVKSADELLGATTMRTMGTVEALAGKFFDG